MTCCRVFASHFRTLGSVDLGLHSPGREEFTRGHTMAPLNLKHRPSPDQVGSSHYWNNRQNSHWNGAGNCPGWLVLMSKRSLGFWYEVVWKQFPAEFTLGVPLPSPWRRQWRPTPVLLPGKSHGQRTLVGCSPWGCTELDMTKRLHFHFSLSCIGEGNGNPLQCSCLENPRNGGA